MSSIPVAGKFISTIIGEEVIELSNVPVERKSTDDKGIVVTRSSFIARIRTGEKVKDVMIKVYEVSPAFNNALFIRYLESRNRNRKPESGNKDSDRETYCIVILPDGIGIKDMPVVKVNVHSENGVNSDELPNGLSDESIQLLKQLHHRSWIIQIPELNGRRRNSVEVLLSIFDQTRRTTNDNIFLNIYEEDFPEEYHPVIRRLERAASNNAVCNTVRIEDDYTAHIKYTNFMREEAEEKTAAAIAVLAEGAEKEAVLAKLAALKAKSNTEK
jgi:hypothetical protein